MGVPEAAPTSGIRVTLSYLNLFDPCVRDGRLYGVMDRSNLAVTATAGPFKSTVAVTGIENIKTLRVNRISVLEPVPSTPKVK